MEKLSNTGIDELLLKVGMVLEESLSTVNFDDLDEMVMNWHKSVDWMTV